MNTKMKKLMVAAAAVLGASASQAVSLPLFTGAQLLSDNSAEFLIDQSERGTAGVVDVGDRLIGIFSIDTAEQSPNPTRTLATYGVELTGYFDLTVVGKTGGPGAYSFIFAATDPTGVAVSLYSSNVINFTRNVTATATTVADMIALATDGDDFATFGFAGAGNFWAASAITDNIAAIGAIPSPGNGGGFNLALNVIDNNSGYLFNKVDCFNPLLLTTVKADVCGSGSLLGKGGESSPFASYDDVNFRVDIPEPASLSLVGAALVSAAIARRRSKKQAK